MVLEAQVSELGSCALGNHWKHPQRCVRNCGQTLSEAFYLVIFSPNLWPLCQHTSQPALIVGRALYFYVIDSTTQQSREILCKSVVINWKE